MGNRDRLLALCLFALLAVLLAACNSSGTRLYKVRGKVLHQGKPAAGVIVTFHRKDRDNPNEPVPYGETDQEGNFSLTTPPKDEGAAPGEYTVTLFWPDPHARPSKDGERPDLLKGAYSDAKNPQFRAEVRATDNELRSFDLK